FLIIEKGCMVKQRKFLFKEMISGIHCLLESFNCKGERQDESFICCRCFEWIFSGIIRCFWCSRIRRQDFGKVDRYLGKSRAVSNVSHGQYFSSRFNVNESAIG